MGLFRGEKIDPPPGKAGKWNVIVKEEMCKACNFCISICPVDVFAWRDRPNRIGWIPVWVSYEENCIGCMLCYQICPDFCIDVRQKIDAERQKKKSVEIPANPQELKNER